MTLLTRLLRQDRHLTQVLPDISDPLPCPATTSSGPPYTPGWTTNHFITLQDKNHVVTATESHYIHNWNQSTNSERNEISENIFCGHPAQVWQNIPLHYGLAGLDRSIITNLTGLWLVLLSPESPRLLLTIVTNAYCLNLALVCSASRTSETFLCCHRYLVSVSYA